MSSWSTKLYKLAKRMSQSSLLCKDGKELKHKRSFRIFPLHCRRLHHMVTKKFHLLCKDPKSNGHLLLVQSMSMFFKCFRQHQWYNLSTCLCTWIDQSTSLAQCTLSMSFNECRVRNFSTYSSLSDHFPPDTSQLPLSQQWNRQMLQGRKRPCCLRKCLGK